VFFDGVCVLCNRAVQFLIRHDRNKRLRFAHLNSAHGRTRAAQPRITRTPTDTVLLWSHGRFLTRSDAAIAILRELGGVWKTAALFRIVPRFVRDAMYDLLARNRYRWFGRYDECPLPSPGLRDRLLTEADDHPINRKA